MRERDDYKYKQYFYYPIVYARDLKIVYFLICNYSTSTSTSFDCTGFTKLYQKYAKKSGLGPNPVYQRSGLSNFTVFGTSGSKIVDQFISKNKLKCVPYNKFKNIEYIDKGGFGTIYKAKYKSIEVIFKYFDYFNNSDESLNELLNEWKIINSCGIIKIYGFTKDPVTLNYVLIMEYINKGSLKRCLTKITKNWKQKLFYLYQIIKGLNDIHEKDLIHYNFHNGNILCNKYEYEEDIYRIFISDYYLGLYQLAKSFLKENDIYGVLPFIAPEILRGQPYTQASDIYSFSIIMWEFTSKILPFNDKAHDLQLALSICKGERPEIIENTPQCYIDLMKKCWNENPLKRPSSKEVLDIIKNWIIRPLGGDINEELKSNIMEFINAPIEHNNLIVESHPKACYTSHLLDFTSKELNELLILEDPWELIELKQKYQSSFNELQNIQMELTLQNEEFAKKESTLQIQITNLQSEKQALDGKLTEQLKQNSQLNQEKNNLQDKLVQTETIVQELKSQQDQFKNQINQFQIGYKQIEEENLKLEKIAETYYQSSQNELINLQQRNFQTEKEILKLEKIAETYHQSFQNENNQNLRLKLAKQIKEFAKKENILQTQIIDLQNEKQNLAGNLTYLTEQLEQNKLTNQQVQDQISQLKQEETKLQEKLSQIEANIQELKSHKESLIEQKEQLENNLNQFQVNYEQTEQEKIRLYNMTEGLLQEQKLKIKLKIKLEKEIVQLKQKLIIEEQIKVQLTRALQIKEDKINELEQKLINLDQDRIKKLQDKRKKLIEIEKELLNKLTSGKNTKEIHKEEEAKQKEMNELQQELSRTTASYNVNRKKQVFNQVNNFLKVKGDFLTLREEAIKKLQNCCNHLESSINKERNTIGSNRNMKILKLTDKYTKEFQSILVKYNDGLLELNKNYYSLKKIVQENKELEVNLIIENIFKLNSFNLDKYKIFKFATYSQEGTGIQLNSNMMSEDINSLRKNLNELKLELNQEKKELKKLATV
ncbi:hypothetical protein RhiirC2_849292 [Rhizophagus irregularis]|uniref:Protein kinase domain-containing protein n=2 Tax=Rhizophagus irregularis TaxID=588596 RepID=A0A2N1NBM2_9GLOM|nr:hypothetical protein RhiirC2_849292 [Rhizophagus irregularis]